jgi:hypothetical protein
MGELPMDTDHYRLESKLSRMESRLSHMEWKMSGVESRLRSVERRMGELEERERQRRFNRMLRRQGILLVAWAVAMGVILGLIIRFT